MRGTALNINTPYTNKNIYDLKKKYKVRPLKIKQPKIQKKYVIPDP